MSQNGAVSGKQLQDRSRMICVRHTCLRTKLFITIMGEMPGCEPVMKGTRGAVGMFCAAEPVGPMSSKSVWSRALKYPELASTV